MSDEIEFIPHSEVKEETQTPVAEKIAAPQKDSVVTGTAEPYVEKLPESQGTRLATFITPKQMTDYLPIITIQDLSKLPSRGLSYPPGATISYTPYTFGDTRKDSQSKRSDLDMYKDMLEGITCEGFSNRDLTYNDFLFIELSRKLSTLGPTRIIVTFGCSHEDCKNVGRELVDISATNENLYFMDIMAPEVPMIITFPFGEYEFMPLTVDMYFDLMEKKLEGDTHAVMSKMCVSHPFEEVYKNIQPAWGDDLVLLEEVDKQLDHGLMPIPMKCKKCLRPTYVRLESEAVIIRPFRPDRDSIENRIRFGKKSSPSTQ